MRENSKLAASDGMALRIFIYKIAGLQTYRQNEYISNLFKYHLE